MIMNKSQYKECIEQEIYTPYRNAKNRCGFLDKIWLKYICPESNALFLVRQKMYFESIGGGYRILARLLHSKLVRRYGIHIDEGTEIGIGLRFQHPISIVITKCKIRENFYIYQNCTVGQKFRNTGLFPSIGDNVTMCAGSSVIGNVSVTNNVIIGAGACLVKDADEPGTYVGVPAKRIGNAD